MAGKITVALLAALTIISAPLPASARTCILSNAASAQACKPACCANMTCCKTSSSNTAPSNQPVAKSIDDSNAALVFGPIATVSISIVDLPLVSIQTSKPNFFAHSPPILALVCARLI
jgi:hypothetical protein